MFYRHFVFKVEMGLTFVYLWGSFRIICFDHRKSAVSKLGSVEKRFKVNVDVDKSSSKAVYEYFSSKLASSEVSKDNVNDLVTTLF